MYTPVIGDSGIYALQEPFNTLVTPQVVYTCRSIRTINDVIATGVLPYDKYYKPFAISETSYLKDVANNICIVGLQAGTGEWIYVPETYILNPPRTAGVKYSSIVLGVGLGAIPDQLSLEALTDTIKDIVNSSIGVEPKIKAVLVSQPAFIDHSKHERLEAARKARISMNETAFAKSKRLEAELTICSQRIKELEAYIKKTI